MEMLASYTSDRGLASRIKNKHPFQKWALDLNSVLKRRNIWEGEKFIVPSSQVNANENKLDTPSYPSQNGKDQENNHNKC